MKPLSILFLIFILQTSHAQEINKSQAPAIDLVDLFGTWTNMSNFLISNKKFTKGNQIGNISDNKISIPGTEQNHFIAIEPGGKFRDMRYPNATWKIVDDHIVITSELGQDFKGLLSKNDSTGVYFLTFNGETFTKKDGFTLTPIKH